MAGVRAVLKVNKLKFVFSALILTLSIDAISAGNTQDVADKAYLQLNHELNQEHAHSNQTNTEEGAHSVFSSGAFAAVRGAIGGSQANQLGDKISTALANTAINKTENIINQTAN